MQVKVLKAFDYGHDGINIKRLEKGDTAVVRDELVPGLAADGFVEKAKGAPPPAKDEAPKDAPKDPPKDEKKDDGKKA